MPVQRRRDPSGAPGPGDGRAGGRAPAAGWSPGVRLLGPLVTVHRQPVVTPDGAVRGYAVHVAVRTPLTGARHTVDAATLVQEEYARLDLAALTGGTVAYLRATAGLLTGDDPLPDSPGGLVLVVPPDLALADDAGEHLARLRSAGVRLALGDYRADDARAAMLPLVDLVTVDLGRGPAVAAAATQRAHAAGRAVLAERVDTEAAARFAAAHAVDLLQGPLFPRDTTARPRELTAGQLQCLELMQLLSADPVDQDAVVAMVAADPELSMRVLRLVNLSAFAVRRRIDSVRQAVVLVGPAHLASLAVSGLVGARPSTVGPLWFALTRAAACRTLGRHDNAATVGLLSAVAAQLRMSPLDLVARTGVSDDVAAALRDRTGPWGPVLAAVLAHEADDPEGVLVTGLAPDAVSDAYLDAVTASFTTATSLAGAA